MENHQNLKTEAYETAKKYMSKLVGGIDLAVSYVHQNDEDRFIDIFMQIIDGMEWLNEALTLTKDIQEGELEPSELQEKLPDLLEALENKDYILIGDILDYEIKPIILKWSGQLN